MLFVKIFGEDGGRLGCCRESDSSSGDHRSPKDDDRRGNNVLGEELALGDGRDASSNDDAYSEGSSSDDNYDELPHRGVKVEEDSD